MSLYRNTIWFLKGLREYTKGGFERAAVSFSPTDLVVDCSGKIYMITGGNSGLGLSTAKAIASKGGAVHLVCRNIQTAEAAKVEIIKETGNQNVFVHRLDLSNPKDVVQFGSQFAATNDRLDTLVNNAGCMINERKLTEDQFEANFATNTLGTHLLTMSLLPLLEKTKDSRVVTVSSGGMLVQKLNANDLQFEHLSPFDGTMAYSQNKRQQVVLTELYAKKFPQVHFYSCHPGWADTPAVQTSMPDFHAKMANRLRTCDQGADTIIWCSVATAALNPPANGLFYQDRTPVATHLPLARTYSTVEEKEEFWSKMEDLRAKYTSA